MNHSNFPPAIHEWRFRAVGRLPAVLLVAILGFGIAGQQAVGQGEDRETRPASDAQAAEGRESPDRDAPVDESSTAEALKERIRQLDEEAKSLRSAGRFGDAKQHADKADVFRRWLAESEKIKDEPDNLVTNGSFERRQTGMPPNHYEELRAGQTELEGWKITGDNIDWLGPTRWQAAHAAQCLDLDARSGIRQTIKTVPGKPYRLQFHLAGNVEGGPAKRILHVMIDNEVLDFAFDITGKTKQKMGWVSKEIVFTATGETTRLDFVNPLAKPSHFGVALDHVSVRRVDPEKQPATPTEKVDRHSAAEETPAASLPAPTADALQRRLDMAALAVKFATLHNDELYRLRLEIRELGKRQQAAIDWVRKMRGSVYFAKKATESDWRQQFLGESFPRRVTGLTISSFGRHGSDLSPLAALENLRGIALQGTPVSDLSPLAGLRDLERINLNGTNVSDLSPLAGLHHLAWLGLNRTKVKDLSPLAGLQNLRELSLDQTPVSDLAPLAGLESLWSLELTGTKARDLSPLARLRNLERLQLDNTPVSDLPSLNGLENLKELNLSRTKVSDLPLLTGLKNLANLNLARTPITDLSPLSSLQNLKQLDLARTPVTDLSPLSGLKNLKGLDLRRTRVSDLSPLAGLQSLEYLRLDGTRLTSLLPLVNVKTLKSLYIVDTKFPLAELKRFKEAVPNCQVNHIDTNDPNYPVP